MKVTFTPKMVIGFVGIFIAFPVIILLIYIAIYANSTDSTNAELIVILGFLIFTGCYWIALRYVRQGCDQACGRQIWGVCAVVGCCYATLVILMVLVAFRTIYYNATEYREAYSGILRYLFAVLILILWGFIQYTCLHQSYQSYQRSSQEAEISTEIQALRRTSTISSQQVQTLRSLRLAQEPAISTTTKCVYYGNIAGNIALGVCFVVCEALLIDEVIVKANTKEWDMFATEMFISLFMLFAVIFFIPFSASLINYENKQFCTVAFVVFIPLMVISGIYRGVVASDTLLTLLRVMLITIPVFGLYLCTLNYVRKRSDNIYRAYLTVSGFGFVFPWVLSGTMYVIGYYEFTHPLVIAGIVLFSVCTFILAVFFLVQLIMKIKQTVEKGYNFSEANFSSAGNLVNSSGGIVGIGILTYVYATCPESDTFNKSTIYAVGFFVLFITVCINIVLRLKVPKGIVSHHLDYLFSDFEDPLQEHYYWEKLLQKMGIVIGIMALPIICLISYLVISAEAEKTFFLVILIGIIIIAIFFIVLLELRRRIGIYAKNCLPLCTSCVWIFVLLPLLVGAPVAVIYLGTSNDNYQKISGYIISFVCVVMMIGVTICAIAVNYVFKQMEVERKAKFSVKYMRAALSRIAVRSSEDLLRLLYDQHRLHGEDVLNEVLNKGAVVFWWPIPDRDPDPKHNRHLVDSDQYQKLKAVADKSNLKPKDVPIEKPAEKNEKPYRYCCACCYEDEEDLPGENTANSVASVGSPAAALENAVIKQPTRGDDMIDFKALLQRLQQSEREEQDNYIAGLYVQPFNVLSGEEEEELARGVRYQDYLDIVEDRNINSGKFLEIVTTQENCLRRLYDQIFKAFSSLPPVSLSEDEDSRYYQMSKSDFIDFCVFADIIDRNGTEGALADSRAGCEKIFTSVAERYGSRSVLNRYSFEEVIAELAVKKFPKTSETVAKEGLLIETIYPGLFRSMPELINSEFAKNVLNENYKIPKLYPKGRPLKEEKTYIPVKEGPKYGCCRAACISFNKCLTSAVEQIEGCLRSVMKCFYRIIGCYEVDGGSRKDPSEEEKDDPKTGIISPLRARKLLPTADWPVICEAIVKSIKDSNSIYEKKNEAEQEHVIEVNSVNIIAAINEIYGAYVIASMAFDPGVGWDMPSIATIVMSALKMNSSTESTATPSTFLSMFWVSFALSIIYVLIAVPAARKARMGVLGLGPDGKPAKLFTWPFILSNLANVLGASMYISNITNFLNVFACNYESEPWTTYVVSGLTCWNGIHFLYVFCALVGVALYYPMATFMFPNLQFQDKLLDLKFYPPFMVLLSQVKLFMAGLGVFYTTDVFVTLIFTGSAMFVLGIVCLRMQPCLAKGANLWYATEYFTIAWVMAGGVIMYLIRQKVFCLVFIGVGVVGIILSAYLVSRCWYKTNGLFVCFDWCCQTQGQGTPEDPAIVVPVAIPASALPETPANLSP